MSKSSKEEFRQVFNEGFEQLILPHFDNIYRRFDDIDKKFENNEEDHINLGNSIVRIEQKLDAEITWRDDASKRIKKVEVKLGFAK